MIDIPDQFYADIEAFSDFAQIANLDHYHSMPDEWVLLVADVVQSTKAIEQGAYKSVNMVGAASIICVLNCAGDIELPFVFGGDGGMIAVPPSLADQAKTKLRCLQGASKEMFGLTLRAAAIPVKDLRQAGADTRVRKYALSDDNFLAMFAGGGPMLADTWLKSEAGAKYALAPQPDDPPPDLEGLSCRWQPIQSLNGTMLTIIATPLVGDAGSEIVTINDNLASILRAPLRGFAPAKDANLKFNFPPKGLSLEVATGVLKGGKFGRWGWAMFTSLMQYLCEKFGIKIGDYNGATYRDELKANTDFRKYDGALRMVLDVSEGQATEIEAFLEVEFQARRLVYGSLRTSHALMTCLLFDLASSKHIHFIDGADGGYAVAAKGYKRRLGEVG